MNVFSRQAANGSDIARQLKLFSTPVFELLCQRFFLYRHRRSLCTEFVEFFNFTSHYDERGWQSDASVWFAML
jgi:hypothetical protein